MSEDIRTLICREGRVPSRFFTSEIRASWKRCFDLGLDPFSEPRKTAISDEELSGLREENALVRRLALIEMENLHSQIAGSKFLIIYADSSGVILDRLVDDSPSGDSVDRVRPGLIWREETNGTNALGLVAATHLPSIVHGEEHYFKAYTDLTCAASPILGREGKMVGIIDATSNCRSRQQHTLALVRMSCITIENGLFRDRHKDNLIIEMHNRQEFLGTLQSANLAFDETGFLLEPSRQAKFLLQGLSLNTGIHFDEIFRTPYHEFLSQLAGARSVHLVDREGSSFAARAFHNQVKKRVIEPAPVNSVYRVAREIGMLYDDSKIKAAMHMVKRAVELNVPILIRGETGTGKELMARLAHIVSGRKGDFVAVNCAALPETLIESELFGHTEGAFTGAGRGGAKGLVQQAHKGTLFLDEIGTMPIQLQAKLLRFLDRMEVRPLGETKELKLDIQLVSATNSQLPAMESADEFRSDLLYRINTMEVCLPSLREREDFQAIVEAIAKKIDPALRLEPDAVRLMAEHHWAGNIRELKSFMTRLLISCESGIVRPEDIRKMLPEPRPGFSGGKPTKSLADQERRLILAAYERHQGNISAVSRELNISRNKVYKKLKESWTGQSSP